MSKESISTMQKPWRRIRKLAGLEDVRIHDLRHTFASGGLLVGEGLPMIGKLLGHRQVQTTARYAHLAADPIKQAATRISERLAEALG
jgi:integrase